MTPKLIVVTGTHRIVREHLIERASRTDGLSFFPSIEDDLRLRSHCRANETCPVFDELLMLRELERDANILDAVREGRTAVIEQWHLGNLASIQVRSPSVAESYWHRLSQLLQAQKDLAIVTFYVSIDVEKLPDNPDASEDQMRSLSMRQFYTSAQGRLAELIKTLPVALETIDGEAPRSFIDRRLDFLLDLHLGAAV